MHRGHVLSTLFGLLPIISCGGDGAVDDRREAPPGSAACVPGELTLPDGRCQPAGLPPDMACPPGERALPTSADGSCQPAGVPAEACAAGRFVPSGRGGCAPILPEERCPPGQMAVPGETACREVAPCGAGPWNAGIPEEATTEYVDQGYPGSDSDGSRARPWKTVREGVRAASSGAIVAVAAGSYREDVVVVNKPVRLWGRCPAQTEVVGVDAPRSAITVLHEGASGSEVRGLAVTGPGTGIFVEGARSVGLEELWVHEAGWGGVIALDRAGVTLRGALVEQNHVVGVFVEGSEATIEATVARAQPEGAEGYGRGIIVQTYPATGERGKLLLTASLIEGNHDHGVFVVGSDATVEATVVRATQPGGAGRFGRGIGVEQDPTTGERGKLWLKASLVEENHEAGVLVNGTEATVEATVVRANQPDGAGKGGIGIGVQAQTETGERGKLLITASLVEENHDVGVLVTGAEATVEATVVRATQPGGAGTFGRGIGVEQDSAKGERGELFLTASLVEENHDHGVFVVDAEASVEATVVRATQTNGDGLFGRGIGVESHPGERAKLSLTTSLVEENHDHGVFVGDAEARIQATVVRATHPNGDGLFGRGIDVTTLLAAGERAKLWLTTSLLEENHEFGVMVNGAEATVEATVVRATHPGGTGKFARGIGVQAPTESGAAGQLSLMTSLIEDNDGFGVLISGAEATITDTVVRATKQAAADLGFGDGIMVLEDQGPSRVTIAATESMDNARAGVMYVGSTGELSLVRSSGNRFGLVLQLGTHGAEPTLGEGNLLEGNTERDKLIGGNLPVPDAAAPVP